MTDHFELIVAGKNIVLNAKGFLEHISIKVEDTNQTYPLKKGLTHSEQVDMRNHLLATVHNGQPMLIRRMERQSKPATDKALQDFTRSSGTDALRFTLDEQFQFHHYFYYRAGQLIKSTMESSNSNMEIPYEKMGSTPELVLTAFCDSWLVLQQLEWKSYRLQPSLEGA
jgi:hypothetical protein